MFSKIVRSRRSRCLLLQLPPTTHTTHTLHTPSHTHVQATATLLAATHSTALDLLLTLSGTWRSAPWSISGLAVVKLLLAAVIVRAVLPPYTTR